MKLRPVEHLLAIALATPPEPTSNQTTMRHRDPLATPPEPTSNQTTMRHRDPLAAIAERHGVPRDRLVALWPEPRPRA